MILAREKSCFSERIPQRWGAELQSTLLKNIEEKEIGIKRNGRGTMVPISWPSISLAIIQHHCFSNKKPIYRQIQ